MRAELSYALSFLVTPALPSSVIPVNSVIPAKAGMTGWREKGFTLLEIIVALFIFSIVSMIMVAALHSVLTSQSSTASKAERLAKLQVALLLLSRDVEQTLNRPVIDAQGAIQGFIGQSDMMTFTHAGLANPFGQLLRTTLQRTRYQFSQNNLIRMTWPALDLTRDTTSDSRTLLTNISTAKFEYLDSKGHFQSVWPPLDQQNAILPRAVRVSLTLKNWGKIQEIYIIASQPLEIQN